MTRFAPGDDTNGLEAAVGAACHAVERIRTRGAGRRGLSSGALDLLIRLHSASDDGVSIGDLLTARNVTGLVDTLERDGLARRVPSRSDRRSVLVEVTPAGRAWVESFRRPAQVAMAAIFDGFALAELTQLRHLCLRLVQNQRRIDERLRWADGTVTAEPRAEQTGTEDLIP